MRYKITFVTGLAAGFVLGTRAGRERYEQIRSVARTVMDNPTVQQATGAAQAKAGHFAHSAREIASDKGRVMGDRLSTAANNHLPPRLTEKLPQRNKPTSDWAEYPSTRDGYLDE